MQNNTQISEFLTLAEAAKRMPDPIDLAGEILLYYIANQFTPKQRQDFWKALEKLLRKHAEGEVLP